jgi:hypothetical protein
MKKMFCLLLVFWLSLLISHCAGPIEQPTGSVKGVVKDSDSQPIEGARVVVDTTNLQAITDSRGYYQLTSVPAGQRTLIASKSGYVSETKVVNVGAGQIVKVDFTLQTQGAQQVVWQKTFGGSDDDRARSVQETIDGGYVVAGYTWSSSKWEDVYILKLDANGNKLWEKTFGGSDNDGAWFIQQTIDGGYIVAGYTKSYGSGWYDAYLLKLDGAGNKVWEKVFGGSSWDEARSIQQTNDGGYIVAGYTSSFGAGSYDVYVLKLDTSGKEVWSKTFGGSSDDLAWSIQQTNDGGYIVAGYTKSFGAGSEDVYILKLDANGNKLWEKTFGGSYDERAYRIQQTRDGGYIVAGYTSSFGVGNYDVYIIKMDANGNTGAYPTDDE